MSYYGKYIKYKNKYLDLKRQTVNTDLLKNSTNDMKYNFYFLHATKNIDNILALLKKGKLLPGKDVNEKYRFLNYPDPMEYIFANIYFEDIQNLTHMRDYTLILSPDILTEQDAVFNKGWLGGPETSPIGRSIYINKNDDIMTTSKKIKEFKEFLKDPSGILPQRVVEFSPFHHHEIVFSQSIDLKNHLLGIVCHFCQDNPKFEKVKQIMHKKYPKAKIFTDNYPFPTLNELLK